MPKWYARPVLFTENLSRSLNFYVATLGFAKAWQEGGVTGNVCQVGRDGCEIILCENAGRPDRGRLYIELDPIGMTALNRMIDENSIPHKSTWWDTIACKIDDPDGNELLFPLPGT
jgi:catechol 2,3-dioxygenase-like lactoylglutathione lyase family enzyme